MALPSFTLTGNLKEIVSDVDTGELTEAVLSRASIVFESNVGSDTLITWEDTAYAVEAIVGRIDTTGAIVNIDGAPLELLAQDDGLNVTGLQWRVSITIPTSSIPPLARKQIRPFWIDAPNDGDTVDLAEVLPVPGLAIQGVTPLTRASLLGLIEDSASDVHDAIAAFSSSIDTFPSDFPADKARPGFYDPLHNCYNFKAHNTRRLRASRGKAAMGQVQHWAGLGDSIMAGYMGTGATTPWDPQNSYLRFMRATLAAKGIPVGGTGIVPFTADTFSGPTDPRWTTGSGWIIGTGLGSVSTFTNGAAATFVSDSHGTQVDVFYLGDTGSANVNVDGLGTHAVTMAAGIQKYTLGGLADTEHSVVITSTSTGAFTLIGASVTASSGLVVHNLAMGGSKTADWVSGNLHDTRSGALTKAGITPAVIFIELSGNDHLAGGISGTTVKSNITSLRNQYPDSDAILVAIPTWSYYLEEMYDLADSLDIPLIDWFDRTGGLLSGQPGYVNGLINDTSGIHPLNTWHADAGMSLGELVSA